MEKLKTVYRIEHKQSAKGPFFHFHSDYLTSTTYADVCRIGIRIPAWYSDGIDCSPEYRACFLTRKKLNEFFGPIIVDLKKLGFKIKIYKIERTNLIIGKSKMQGAFLHQ